MADYRLYKKRTVPGALVRQSAVQSNAESARVSNYHYYHMENCSTETWCRTWKRIILCLFYCYYFFSLRVSSSGL